MTLTPWGDSQGLRSRKLPPGPGRDQQTVSRSQLERLFAATVAVVADKDYDATRVEDILVMAGVSRNTFYRYFSNKRECFLATLEAINEIVEPAIVGCFEQAPGPWDRKLAVMLDSLAAMIVAQPALARVAWVEVHAGGSEALEIAERIDRKVEDVVIRALKESPERAGMPREIVSAVVGGVNKIVHTRVRQDRTAELPELMPRLYEWMVGYETPPERLRRPRRVPPELVAPMPAPPDPRERILRSVVEIVAEQGYAEMAITEIAARASVSLTTFYTHFEGKEAAFLEALADVQQRVFAATVPHFAEAEDWATAVAVSSRSFLGFLTTHPDIARFGGVGVWATSPAGLELRAQGLELFISLLDEGFRQYPDTDPVAAEAIGATVDALLFNTLHHKGPEQLYGIAPTACYITLAPFVGTERACQLANSPPLPIGQTTL